MVTSGIAQSGRVTSVWGVAQFNTAVSTKQLKALNRLPVAVKSKVQTRSASGVTGAMEMDP